MWAAVPNTHSLTRPYKKLAGLCMVISVLFGVVHGSCDLPCVWIISHSRHVVVTSRSSVRCPTVRPHTMHDTCVYFLRRTALTSWHLSTANRVVYSSFVVEQSAIWWSLTALYPRKVRQHAFSFSFSSSLCLLLKRCPRVRCHCVTTFPKNWHVFFCKMS